MKSYSYLITVYVVVWAALINSYHGFKLSSPVNAKMHAKIQLHTRFQRDWQMSMKEYDVAVIGGIFIMVESLKFRF